VGVDVAAVRRGLISHVFQEARQVGQDDSAAFAVRFGQGAFDCLRDVVVPVFRGQHEIVRIAEGAHASCRDGEGTELLDGGLADLQMLLGLDGWPATRPDTGVFWVSDITLP
jgi:hypothetical protein